ncbi:hypothetical protein [Polymorphospora rubra]|uniref:DUF2637 domain-containing protein n=1 Tax=Polymorphospora rubra TaxID=338584 RepID=A0A810N7K9_9ACTN|nr:hypothetical protein [Polymorphospora rubra]BCJ67623.1 hypothetical protein Prubr_46440 [Polymorphospora rubra]
MRPPTGPDTWLGIRWLLAVGAGLAIGTAALASASRHAAGALGVPLPSTQADLAMFAAWPIASLGLAWRWRPARRRGPRAVVPLAMLLSTLDPILLANVPHTGDPLRGPLAAGLAAFALGVLATAPIRRSIRAVRGEPSAPPGADRQVTPPRNRRPPAPPPGPAPRSRPRSAPAGNPGPDPHPGPARSDAPAPEPAPAAPPGPAYDPRSAAAPAPAAPAPAAPGPVAPPAPPAQAAGRAEAGGPDTRAVTIARQVEVVVEDAARRVAPLLERRLVAYHGPDWLEAVNQRRRQAGHKPGRRLRDFRFCLAVLGHDPATQGWANRDCRRAALDLNRLAFDAVHRGTLTVSHLERAQKTAARLLANLPAG